MSPLASDPAIQAAITDQITTQVFTYIHVLGLTNQAVDALAERDLTSALADQLDGGAGGVPVGLPGRGPGLGAAP